MRRLGSAVPGRLDYTNLIFVVLGSEVRRRQPVLSVAQRALAHPPLASVSHVLCRPLTYCLVLRVFVALHHLDRSERPGEVL